MKFYVTDEGIQKLKRSFLNLKLFSIIDVQRILEDYGYTYSTIDDYGAFIINEQILALIKNYSKSKRIRGIIYSNPNLSDDIILNLQERVEKQKKINEFVLIDEYNLPRLQQFYPLFNEIIFFPSIKKVRLIECKSIKDKINWKI
jgi:hypothetical protein